MPIIIVHDAISCASLYLEAIVLSVPVTKVPDSSTRLELSRI